MKRDVFFYKFYPALFSITMALFLAWFSGVLMRDGSPLWCASMALTSFFALAFMDVIER